MGRLNFSTVLLAFLCSLISSLVVVFFFLSQTASTNPTIDEPVAAFPGTSMLSAFRCLPGETKKVIIKGAEDNYSLSGDEPAKIHERLGKFPGLSAASGQYRDYDETGYNKLLADYFELPGNISHGLFVVRMKSLEKNSNDFIYFGDQLDRDPAQSMHALHSVSAKISWLNEKDDWKISGDVYSVHFEDLILRLEQRYIKRKYDTFLEYLQSGQSNFIIDLFISDDTIVDFAGMAYCTRPQTRQGVTLAHNSIVSNIPEGVSFLSCHADITQPHCNPYYGDTPCTTALPIACFHEANLPLPGGLETDESIKDNWSGGEIAYTAPQKGNMFSSISDVNAMCRIEFGPDWRVVNFHDGARFNIIAALKGKQTYDRVWIDIKDQPEATCWTR